MTPLAERVAPRLIAILVGVDLVFKISGLAGFAHMVKTASDAPSEQVVRTLLFTSAYAMTAWIVALVWLMRPIDRWERDVEKATERETHRASLRLDQLPTLFAAAWTTQSFSAFAAAAWIHDALGDAAILCFLGSLAVGVPVTAYLLTLRLTEAGSRRMSTIAQRRSLVLPVQGKSMRQTLTFITWCLVTAPALYLSSAVLSGAQREPVERLALVMLCLMTVAITATLSTAVLGRWLTAPIAEITALMRTIADQRDADVSGLPLSRGDEIGALARAAHAMSAKLDEVNRERAELYGTLERRVDQRTAELVAVNGSLQLEMDARLRLESDLRQAQKLEAVGRLAAGMAHEINTPLQFVSDSVHFLRDATNDVFEVLRATKAVRNRLAELAPAEPTLVTLAAAEERAELAYLSEQLPLAFSRCVDGIERVTSIVRAMKEFAHPDTQEMTAIDLNHAIASTLTIARNEYKYVADIETDFGAIPPVPCFAGGVNQVVLNMIVNAAHAIGEVVRGTERRGKIRIATRHAGDDVVITVTDDGCGIPESIRERVFDPFFTTKGIGVGTGQGLAVARSVIVDKHGGDITLDSEVGHGTTFTVFLPLHRAVAAEEAA